MSEESPQVVLDRSLASRVAAGDQDAFDGFFREYFPRLYRFILSRVDNNPELAEEIVQRTMCIVVRKMGSYRGEALLFTWLCQICRNETRAVYRKHRLELQEDIPIEDHPAVQAALESGIQISLWVCLLVVVIYGFTLTARGETTGGQLVAFLLLAFRVTMPLTSLTGLFSSAQGAVAAAGRLDDIFALKPEREPGSPVNQNRGTSC